MTSNSILAAATANSVLTPPATSSASSSNSASSLSSAQNSALSSQQTFLTLLVTQMQNQDPMNPMDSSQMTSQLAQISTVQGIQGVASQLTSILSSINAGQAMQASSLVGQQVLVPGNTLSLQNGQATGGASLSQAADQVTVTINSSSGTPVQTLNLGAQPSGVVNFTWNGNASNGSAAANGGYTFTVNATSSGQPVSSTALSAGKVSGVTPGTNGASLDINGLGTFATSQIQQIL